MTQKEIKQTIYNSLRCDMTTVKKCMGDLNDNTPDSLRKAESMRVRYYRYDDGRENEKIILFSTKFKDDCQPWFFSVYLD